MSLAVRETRPSLCGTAVSAVKIQVENLCHTFPDGLLSAARPSCDGDAEQSATVNRLRAWIHRRQQRRARRSGWMKGFIHTGLERLDAALPGGGVPNGAVSEIYSEAAGVGALTLALRIAARAVDPSARHAWTNSSNRHSTVVNRRSHVGCGIVVVDAWGDFYPPAAEAFGIDPESLIVIRGVSQRDAFWAVDQCLRCSGVAAVIAPLSRLDDRESRRLQLAAECSGAVGLLLRGGPPRGRTFAAVRMLVEGVAASTLIRRSSVLADLRLDPLIPLSSSLSSSRAMMASARSQSLCRITLLSVREGMPADPFVMDLHHATGACDLFSIPGDRPAANIG